MAGLLEEADPSAAAAAAGGGLTEKLVPEVGMMGSFRWSSWYWYLMLDFRLGCASLITLPRAE